MTNIKNVETNKIKINKQLYKNIRIYYIGHMTVKYLSQLKTKSVNPLYLTIDKINGYIEESNLNKYLTLFPTDESQDILKRYETLWPK